MVNLKLFRRGFFFPRCAAVGCRTGSRRSARGSSTCRTRLFFIVALTSSPTSSPTFSASKPCLKRQLSDHILCERQRSDAFPASVLHPDSEPRATVSVSSPGLAPKMIFLFRLACRLISTIENAPDPPDHSKALKCWRALLFGVQRRSVRTVPDQQICCRFARAALRRPYVKGYRGYLKIEFPRHPDASVEQLHLYSIDAALACDRADLTRPSAVTYRRRTARGSWIHDAQFGSEYSYR